MFARAAGSRVHATLVCGLVAVAAASASLTAQVTSQRPPADSARVDTLARPPAVARDSIKAPLPAAELPALAGGTRIRWGRDQIFQTGAINAAELISRVPGVMIMRTGFAMAPQTLTWLGETGRVRVFLDGIELDVLNGREGSVAELGSVTISQLEEFVAEATPAELRVHLRSWRSSRTTPETRVDVLTGDAETNLYRGYFGRRFQSGLGLQFGFEQLGTQTRNIGGDGDALSLFLRTGWARGDWGVDVTVQRDRRSRTATTDSDVSDALVAFEGTRTTAYGRVSYRNPDTSSFWAQFIAARDAFHEESPFGLNGAVADSADTNVFRPQYIATAGMTLAGVRASASLRLRHAAGENYLSPAVRASLTRPRFVVSAYAEHRAHDSTLRADAGIEFTAIPNRVVLEGQAGIRQPTGDNTDTDALFFRAGVALRAKGLWLRAGVIQRDSVVSRPPSVFGAAIVDGPAPAVFGQTLGVSGAIYKDFGIDLHGILWDSAGYYRPKSELTGRIYLESDWRSKFPQGHFTIRASLLVERRDGYFIPLSSGDVAMVSAMPMMTNLEIRIKSATISWQFRNLFGALYETVPGFTMPRRMNLYGVRWNFTN